MRHIEILLPFALPPAEMAPDLVRELSKPEPASGNLALATLLARGNPTQAERSDEFTGALPHEGWLARRFGLDTSAGGLPLAALALQTYSLPAQPGWWFILNPVHFHVARDHLVLTDPRQLVLDETESKSLFEAALPAFQEAGHTLLYGDAGTWFLRADAWRDLQTSTPDASSGHNIDIWMPKSADDTGHPRQWRKLQNEVQMEWHAHAVNQARDMRGERPVNSLWLWGGAEFPPQDVRKIFTHLFNLPPGLRACARFGEASEPCQGGAAMLARIAGERDAQALVLLESLQEAALAADWGSWLLTLRSLDRDWLNPVLDALKSADIDSISLVLSDSMRLQTISLTRASLRKFWIKPALTRLLS